VIPNLARSIFLFFFPTCVFGNFIVRPRFVGQSSRSHRTLPINLLFLPFFPAKMTTTAVSGPDIVFLSYVVLFFFPSAPSVPRNLFACISLYRNYKTFSVASPPTPPQSSSSFFEIFPTCGGPHPCGQAKMYHLIADSPLRPHS